MKTTESNIHITPSKKKDEKRVNIVLENELTIYTVENIKNEIYKTFKDYDIIDFKLKKVNNIDLTFIQLFYSLKETALIQNKQVSFDVKIQDDLKLLLSNSDLKKIFR